MRLSTPVHHSQSHGAHEVPHWPALPQPLLQAGFTGIQPSQSHDEHATPHWPEPPHPQLHLVLGVDGGGGGGGGDGASAQPSQSHDEHATPHWPEPPHPQLHLVLGVDGGGGEESRVTSEALLATDGVDVVLTGGGDGVTGTGAHGGLGVLNVAVTIEARGGGASEEGGRGLAGGSACLGPAFANIATRSRSATAT